MKIFNNVKTLLNFLEYITSNNVYHIYFSDVSRIMPSDYLNFEFYLVYLMLLKYVGLLDCMLLGMHFVQIPPHHESLFILQNCRGIIISDSLPTYKNVCNFIEEWNEWKFPLHFKYCIYCFTVIQQTSKYFMYFCQMPRVEGIPVQKVFLNPEVIERNSNFLYLSFCISSCSSE